MGRAEGWVMQREVLGHASTGAFMSHCGWNSLLESLMGGVSVGAWPFFAEQHLNAYYWPREAGLTTEMRIDYSYSVLVEAADVERGICRRIMEGGVRKRLVEMSQTAKNALLRDGSFVDDIIRNVS